MQKINKLYASLFILVSLIILAWVVFYQYGVKILEKELGKIQEGLKSQGYELTYGKVKMSGNPLSMKAIIKKAYLKKASSEFEWQGDELIIHMAPWNYHNLSLTFKGNQKIKFLPNPFISMSELSFEDGDGKITIDSKGKIEAISLTSPQMTTTFGSIVQPISFKDLSLSLENLHRPLTLKMSLQTSLMNLESALKVAPINTPFTINVEAFLSGYVRENPPKSLAEWRDGGGVLNIETFNLSWDPIHFEGEGTLTLDKKMYPLGALSTQISGYQEALSYMVQLGWIKQKNVSTILFVLNLFSTPEDRDSKKLTVPIMIQNKKVSIGPATLLKLQPVPEL